MYSHLDPMARFGGCRDLGVVATVTSRGTLMVASGGMQRHYVVRAHL
jgi:hypothetical protein